jgi:hypothetical protein
LIGVAANQADLQMAGEFFELFKTPWERAVPKRKYPVVLSADGAAFENLESDVFLVYGSGETEVDRAAGIVLDPVSGPVNVQWGESSFPVYGRLATLDGGVSAHTLTSGGRAVDRRQRVGTRTVWRIGYDLFQEIRHLLTTGQPAAQAATPTLELHIALLRHLLLQSGVPFVEIPPRPNGYDFTCCLTHDVDFFGIRRHRFDRTLGGFAARASLVTLADLVRGRRSLEQAVRNWMALLSLPLVFLRLAPDFWRPFDDYARVEEGSRSTFFLVPFKHRPGIAPDGTVDPARAVAYEVSEIREEMSRAATRGSELAVHGLDAWRDAETGRAEMMQLTSMTGRHTAGVRMHWLYMATDSPRRLEAAGFDYDSTWGYNDAVGYRAGTSQVFRLAESVGLMELPLSIMDSALFYRSRMNRSRTDARQDCSRVVDNARRFGGTVVINWHERSLAPERLWGDFYEELIQDVGKGGRAWFTTAGEAVNWFRWRRSFRFTTDGHARSVTVQASPSSRSARPAAVIRIHRPAGGAEAAVEERRLDGHEAIRLEL